MNAQHTGGPWKVEKHDDHLMITDAATEVSAIARVGMRANWDWDRRQIAGANARLIAAAPELLAALVELVAAEDASIDEFTAKEIDAIEAAMDKARAAIRAAKGQP